MRAIILAMILSMVLAGCGTPQQVQVPQIVKVPIPVKCQPTVKVTAITDHPADNLDASMTLYQKNQLLISENYLLDGQNKELTAALAECTKDR